MHLSYSTASTYLPTHVRSLVFQWHALGSFFVWNVSVDFHLTRQLNEIKIQRLQLMYFSVPIWPCNSTPEHRTHIDRISDWPNGFWWTFTESIRLLIGQRQDLLKKFGQLSFSWQIDQMWIDQIGGALAYWQMSQKLYLINLTKCTIFSVN